MSPEPDRTLADPQRVIADLRRELCERTAERDEAERKLVQRTAERDEALEQQAATVEVLNIVNSSPGDLAPVFDAMLEKATGLCDAAFGILWRFDGELAWPGALYRVPDAFAEFWREPRQPSPDTGPGRMMRGESAQAFRDLAKNPTYAAGDAMTHAIVELGGARGAGGD